MGICTVCGKRKKLWYGTVCDDCARHTHKGRKAMDKKMEGMIFD